MRRIGFIGVGRMGEPMAANLGKAGFEVSVYDAIAGRAVEVAARIGATARPLAELAACDAAVCMLPTSGDVAQALIEAEDGALLANARPGLIVIDMSSSEPNETRATGAKLAEAGVTMIDAPVSGGVMRAKDGSLTIMIGCDDPAAIDRAEPVLQAMGRQLFRVGRLGAGDAMKAANNFAAAATYAATAEALTMGKAFGLDPAQMVEIINVSTGRSFVSELVMKDHVVTRAWSTGFLLSLLAKDVGIARRLGEELGLDAPLSELVDERMKQAVAQCGPAADHSEAILGWYKDEWEK
ncbi:MAG TPA: NAD(P)-dependent oxidoreductase [Sphingomonadaceae bacterium]|nr:NAD(P)-dependent oxidoreductase [Sphingomonadaceae bacterium]